MSGPWLAELLPAVDDRITWLAFRTVDQAAAEVCAANGAERDVLLAAVGWRGMTRADELAEAGGVALAAALRLLAASSGRSLAATVADVRRAVLDGRSPA